MNATDGLPYRSDIDVLRAFAVVPVVLFHLGVSWLPGGFLGVDVFFVISGYLITGLLLRELNAGAINLLAFWRRRILRILPALLVMVLVTFVAGHILLYAPDRYMLAVNAAGALLSFGNITHWRNYGGYWSADATDSPLLHTWSLGVEEQFYILYPITLLIAWRSLRDRTSWLLVVGLVVGAGLYAIASQRSPAAAFYLFPTRAWELLAGAVAAACNVKRPPDPASGAAMSLTGLALVVAAYLFATEGHQAEGAFGAVIGATLVVAAGSPAAFTRLRLTARPLILVGLISYSIYLWHWPLVVLGRAVEARHQIVVSPVLYFAASVGLGWISWRFIESPVRQDRRRSIPPALLLCTGVVALAIYSLRDSNNTESMADFLPARWDGERFNVNPVAAWPEFVHRRMRGIDVAPRPSGRESAYLHGIDGRYGEHRELDVLVLGDSHGLMWSPAIDAAARELRLNIRYMTADGTPVFFDPEDPQATHDAIFFSQSQWSAFNRARLKTIAEDHPRVVVIGSAWNSNHVSVAIPLLREMAARGSTVLLLEDAPDFFIGDRNAPSYMAYLGLAPDAQGRVFSKLNDIKRGADEVKAVTMLAAACSPRCSVVPTRDLYEDQKSNLLVVDGQTPVFIDDDHLSVSGAMRAQSRIKAAFNVALETRAEGK